MVGAIGWLPVGQLVSLGLSTIGFAVLARLLGPAPFATYATALFVFTVVSLATDLSSQGFILVNGANANVVRVGWRIVVLSSTVGGITAALIIPLVVWRVLERPLGIVETTLLATALCIQQLGQVPRARLLIARGYRTIALVDVAAILGSVVVSIGLGLHTSSVLVLTSQIWLLALIRTAGLVVGSMRLPLPVAETSREMNFASAARYGLQVMPINVAGYLSRSLDSGLLPGVLPASAAAAYARSYQLVVAPLMQVQLSLGGPIVARLARASTSARTGVAVGIWRFLILLAVAASLVGSLASGLIASLIFGPSWPQANVMIAGMAAILPGSATVMVISWLLQIEPTARGSVRHLVALVVGPICIIAAGAEWGAQGAIATLVISGLFTPGLVLAANWRLLGPVSVGVKMFLITAGCSGIVALIFYVTAGMSGFWGFDAWVK